VTPRLTSVSYPTGQSTTYTYQTGSTQDYRLTDITNYLTGTTVLSKFDYTYNANGTIATWQEQADSNTPTLWTYGYDKADQLLSATQTNTSTSAVLAQYVYGYDLAGNRTSDQVGLGVTQASYNNLNQLSGCSGGGLLQFAGTLSKPAQVTVAGNVATSGNYYSTNFTGLASVTAGTNTVAVIAHDVNGNTATNSYQVVVPSGSTVSPSYDLDGNMTNNGAGQTYTWDSQNGLASITYSTGSNSGNHTEFTYDALGRRINIVELTGTSIGSGTVISTKQYVWVGNTIAEERASNVTTVTKRFFPQGEQQSGTAYYYTSDHLGSVRELVNSSGTLLSRYAYDPYGVVTTTHSAGNTSTPPIDATFQYTGDYLHAASGLNLTKFRAYDPNTARWLSRDPLQDAERSQGPNLYDYVQNNPVNAIDPDGLCTCQSGKWTGTGTAKQGGSGIVVLSGISGTFTGTVTCTSDSSLTATVSGTVGGAGSLFLAVGWSQDFGLTASGSDASSLAGYGVFATISAGKSLGGKVGKYLWTNLNLNLVGAAPGQNVTLSGGPQTNTPTPFGAYMFTWRITQSH